MSSTKQAAITPPSDVNVARDEVLNEDRSRESPARGPRLDGTDEIPDRQVDIRDR